MQHCHLVGMFPVSILPSPLTPRSRTALLFPSGTMTRSSSLCHLVRFHCLIPTGKHTLWFQYHDIFFTLLFPQLENALLIFNVYLVLNVNAFPLCLATLDSFHCNVHVHIPSELSHFLIMPWSWII